MNISHLALPALLAAALAYLLTPYVCTLAQKLGAIDMPGPRKMHTKPIPRFGGAAVVPAILLTLATLAASRVDFHPDLSDRLYLALAAGLAPIFVVSLWDDIHPLGPFTKLAAQFGGAWLAVSGGLHLNETVHLFGIGVPLGQFAIPLSMLWIVGLTNAFNLVDGLDGLSAGLGLISAASLGIVAIVTVNPATAVLSLVVAGALVGFIPYNLHPARLFLGDSGATAVGYLVGCLTLYGGSKLSSSLAVVVPLFFVGVPVADTVISIIRRAVRGIQGGSRLAIFSADREHIHHRLLRLGFDHRRAVLMLCGAGVALAGAGLVSLFLTANNAAWLLASLFAAGVVGVGRLGYDEFAILRGGSLLRVYEAPVIRSGHFKLFVDVALCMVAFYGAVALKYDDWNLAAHRKLLMNGLAVLPAISLVVFWLFGVYRRAWRFAGVGDVLGVNGAVTVSSIVGFLVTRLFLDADASPTLFVTFTTLLVLLTSAGRASFRVLAHFRDVGRAEGRRVAIYGAGTRGTLLLREIRDNARLGFLPIGFIDDDPSNRGRRIFGLPVIGGLVDTSRLIAAHGVEALVIASDSLAPVEMTEVLKVCGCAGIDVYQFDMRLQLMSPPAHPVEAAV
ncbi:MAG TPA: hypothetical protein VNT81_22585 [Vicinamibacterales bacterium]|nr:hypothetical protein [Vicinamibacterales bacterium]